MAGYTRITNYPVIGDWNDNYSALELNSTYSFGRGILSGLTLSAGASLTLNVAAGTLMGLKAVSISGTSTTVPDASTNYVWINEAGAFTTSATTADPGGTYVCLGKVTAAGGIITAVDVTLATGNRMSVWRWTGIRDCVLGESLIYADLANGYVGIGKTPTALFDVNGFGAFTGITLATGTITTSTPQINGTQTWNAGGVTFTGWKQNITDTASAAASLLLDLQVGGTSKFSVKKDGTISAGIWGGTTIGVTSGGTGLTSCSQGDLLYGSAANTLAALAKDTNATRYLSNQGTSNNPSWNQVNLTNGVTGTLPYNNGGTGQSSWTKGDLLYSDANNSLAKLAIGSSGVLGVTAGLPAWTATPTLGGLTVAGSTAGSLIASTFSSGSPTATNYAIKGVIDSGDGAGVRGANLTNYAYSGNGVVQAVLLNGTDTGACFYATNAGTGNYITCDSAFIVYKTGGIKVGASTTARASVNIPSGTAPTSPNSGDMWYDGTNLKFRDGGTTRTITWV